MAFLFKVLVVSVPGFYAGFVEMRVRVDLPVKGIGATYDLLSNRSFSSGSLTLAPYEVLWLVPA